MNEMLYQAKRTPADRAALFERLREAAQTCEKCGLCKTRHNVVFGEGDITSPIVFVGEGPGETEDETGRPFVGRAGELLTRILTPAGFDRDKVYITNIVKCRPPGNRDPQIQETLSCQRWLEAQMALIQPKLVVCLGNTALKWFLPGLSGGITKMRGRWFTWRGAALMPMFHPSYLLRNESRRADGPKALTWQDIQRVYERYQEIVKG